MDARVGSWYLCEAYIQEPVRIEALESDRILVTYLTTGRTRWLGYPRIWQACKPHILPGDLAFDNRSQMVVIRLSDDVAAAAQLLNLNELRALYLPHVTKPATSRSKRPSHAKREHEEASDWQMGPAWEVTTGEAEGISDDTGFALDEADYSG